MLTKGLLGFLVFGALFIGVARLADWQAKKALRFLEPFKTVAKYVSRNQEP